MLRCRGAKGVEARGKAAYILRQRRGAKRSYEDFGAGYN